MNYKKIYFSADHLEIQKILDVLWNNNIPAYTKERGTAQYFQIIGGMAFVEKEIYVAEEDADRAAQLLEALTEPEPMSAQEREIYQVPWYRKRSMLARLCILWTVVFFLIVFILIEFSNS